MEVFEAPARAGGQSQQVLIDNSAIKPHRSASAGKNGEIKPSADRAAVTRQKSTL